MNVVRKYLPMMNATKTRRKTKKNLMKFSADRFQEDFRIGRELIEEGIC